MASQTRGAGVAVDDATVGTRTWSNLDRIVASDDLRVTSQNLSGGQITHYLLCSTFGFTVPAAATIDGIVVNVERAASVAAELADHRVRIAKGGAIGSTDKASVSLWPAPAASEAVASYGSSSDLWGETWTDSDVNAAGFGAALAVVNPSATLAQALVDHVTITVHYTGGGAVRAPTLGLLGVG